MTIEQRIERLIHKGIAPLTIASQLNCPDWQVFKITDNLAGQQKGNQWLYGTSGKEIKQLKELGF